jgi:hypothetical protein
MSIDSNLCSTCSKKQFVKFIATKKVGLLIYFFTSLFVVGSGMKKISIRDKHPGSAIVVGTIITWELFPSPLSVRRGRTLA